MLSPDDASLTDDQRAIPGLGIVLDPDALAGEIARACPGARCGTLEPTYARFKPGTSCICAYVARTEDDAPTTMLYAKAVSAAEADKSAKLGQVTSHAGAIGFGAIGIPNCAIGVMELPNDGALRILRRFAEPDERARLFEKMIPGTPFARHGRAQTLAYKPERRHVARWSSADDSIVVRTYADARFDAAWSAAGAVSSDGPLRVASVLGRHRWHRVLALSWLDGTPLAELVADRSACLLAGRALSRLHAQQPEGVLQKMNAERIAEANAAAAEFVGALCPALAGDAARLADTCSRAAESALIADTMIHADFGADQVVIADDRAGFIDLDNCAIGDPALDVARFDAKLRRDALLGQIGRSVPRDATESLLEGYRREGAADVTPRLAPLTASCLLQLAPSPFRQRHEHWRDATGAVLQAAGEALA